MNNGIFIIKPYKWEGMWVFDDPAAARPRKNELTRFSPGRGGLIYKDDSHDQNRKNKSDLAERQYRGRVRQCILLRGSGARDRSGQGQ